MYVDMIGDVNLFMIDNDNHELEVMIAEDDAR